MTTVNVTEQNYNVTVTEGDTTTVTVTESATTLVTVKEVGPQGPPGLLQEGNVGDLTVSVAGNGTQSVVINSGAINNSKIANNAAIAGTKIDPSFGNANIFTNGNLNIQGGLFTLAGSTPAIQFNDNEDNPDYRLVNSNGTFKIRDNTNGADRIKVNTDGHVDITSNLDCLSGLDVTGDISVSGTVDGRDLAADGSKLDTVETNAKDDQTAAEIKTLLNSNGIVNAQIDASANIANSKLADSGVSAGSFGSGSAIPTITVNDKGIVTGISTNSVDTTTNLSTTTSTTDVTIASSTGNNASISEASGSAAGVMSVAHHDKLDGIESNATADQTAAEIVALLSDQNISTTGTITIENNAPKLIFTDTNNTDYQIKANAGRLQIEDISASGEPDRLSIESDGSVFVHNGLTVQDATGSDPTLFLRHSNINVLGEVFRIGRTDSSTIRYHSIKAKSSGTDSDNLISFHLHDGSGNPFTGQQEVLKLQGDKQVTVFGNLDVQAGLDVTGGDITGVLGSAVTGTTQSAGDNSTKIATTAYTDTAISNLVDSSPDALNTLNELAAALGDDANFSTTVTNQIGDRLAKTGGTLTGDLTINKNNPVITFSDDNNNPDYQVGNINGVLRFQDTTNNATRFQVNTDGHVDFLSNVDFASGIDVTGNITLADNGKIILGDGGETDSFISFDGANLLIKETSATGSLRLTGQNIFLTNPSESDEVYLKCNGGNTARSVELYQGGTKRLETTSTGVAVTGNLTLPDNGQLQLGGATGGDLKIYHDSQNSYIQEVGEGNLFFDASYFTLRNGGGTSTVATFADGTGAVGGCRLFFGGASTPKLSTTATGVDVNGGLNVSAGALAGLKIVDSSNSGGSPYIEVIGKRQDGNGNQAFSGNLYLGGNRTDQKVETNKKLGSVSFGGNHTDGTLANVAYAASIAGIASDNFDSATDMPTDLVFLTGSTGVQPLVGVAGQSNAGTERMRITATGNVGIGHVSTTPTNLLHIYDGNNANDKAELKIEAFRPTIRFQDRSTSQMSAEITGDNSLKFKVSAPVDDDTALTTRMTINTDGTVDFAESIKLQNNKNLNIGGSNNLVIKFDGAVSRVQSDAQPLYFKGLDGSATQAGITMYKGGGAEKMFEAFNDGAVKLYFDNGEKLATTSYGITVNDGDSGFTGTYNARVAAVVEGSNSGGTVLNIMSPASGFSGIFFGDPSSSTSGQIQYQHDAVSGGTPADTWRFINNGGTETMLINTTSIDLKKPVNVTGGVTWSAQSNVTGTIDFAADTLATHTPTKTGSGTETSTDTAIALRRGHQIAVQHNGFVRNIISVNSSKNIEIGQNNTGSINDIKLMPGSSGTVQLFYDGHNNSTPKLATSATGVTVDGNITASGAVAQLTLTETDTTTTGRVVTTFGQLFIQAGATGSGTSGSGIINLSGYSNVNASQIVCKTNLFTINGNLKVDTDTLFVDSTNNKVGVGTASPTKKFMVLDTTMTSTTARDNTVARFLSNASNADCNIQLSNNVDHSAQIGIVGNGAEFYIAQDGIENFRINSSGSVRLKYNGSTTPKLETSTFGIDVNGQVDVDNTSYARTIYRASGSAKWSVGLRDSAGGDTNYHIYREAGHTGEVQIGPKVNATGGLDVTGNANITGTLETNALRFGNSHVKRISVDYVGTSYLVDNEFQEILTITPSSHSQNYSVIGRIIAQSGANTHTLDINISLRSNTLPDLTVTGSYISTITGDTSAEYLTPRLWLKETTTAAFKLVVEINQQIYGRVTADLEIISRSEADLNNIVVNEDETSEVTSLPTGYAQTTPTKIYETDDGSFTFTNALKGDVAFEGDIDLKAATAPKIIFSTAPTRNKLQLYPSNAGSWAIGFDNAMSFGGLNDYATTFQMNSDNDRGWVFLDTDHSDSQGAMALTTDGKMTLAHSLRLGHGESDTTVPGATYALDVSGGAVIADASGSDPTLLLNHSDIDTIGEIIRIGRTDSTDRFHTITARSSATVGNNFLAFNIHNASSSTGRSQILSIFPSGGSINGNWIINSGDLIASGGKATVAESASINDNNLRKIKVSTSAPTSSDGSVGDIWIVYPS